MLHLDQMYQQCAEACIAANVPIDAEPGGAISEWVRQNVKFREGTLFFIVTGIASAMADIEARKEGYKDQLDRAATIAFGQKVRCKWSGSTGKVVETNENRHLVCWDGSPWSREWTKEEELEGLS